MEISKDIFTKWYLNTYSSRILKWDYSSGEVFLIATYQNSSIEQNINDNYQRNFNSYEVNLTIEQVILF